MTETTERSGVSRRLFLGGVGITAGGLMVASGPALWQQAAKAATVTAEQVHTGLHPGAEYAYEIVSGGATQVTDPNTTYPWGLGVFDVNPGDFPGDKTTMTFTYYHTPAATTSAPYPVPVEFDTFTATRTRSDGFGFRSR